MMKVHLLILLLFIPFFANAAVDSSGMMDEILRRYSDAAQSWAGVMIDHASYLFWALVLISMVWTFGMMLFRQADLGEFFAEAIRFIIFTGLYWWMLINGPQIALAIIASMQQIGMEASNIDGAGISPSKIADIGFKIFDQVIKSSSVWQPADALVGMILAIIIMVVLALIAVNMLLLMITAWILAYGGIFFLGFGGARWTSDMAINYYKTVLGIGAQLMAMVLLIGIGQTFISDYYQQMSDGLNLQELGVMLVACAVLAVLVNKIPALVAGIITGASIGGAASVGGFGVGAAAGAAAMAKAAMGGGMAGMMQGVGAGSAIQSAWEAAGGGNDGNEAGNSTFDGMADNSMQGQASTSDGSGVGEESTSYDTPFAEASGANSSSSRFTKAAGILGEQLKNQVASSLSRKIQNTAGGRVADRIRESTAFGNDTLSGD